MEVSKESPCIRGQVGAVIARNGKVISTGYNAPPEGIKPLNECMKTVTGVGFEFGDIICVCIHAEINAIINAYKKGISPKGATIYTTMQPCFACTKMIINVGISESLWLKDFSNHKLSERMRLESKTIFRKFE
jgi:dCMP deaminase